MHEINTTVLGSSLTVTRDLPSSSGQVVFWNLNPSKHLWAWLTYYVFCADEGVGSSKRGSLKYRVVGKAND
jgi:hypothetical protein